MASDPAGILGTPRPAWATEDVVMLQDMAARFMTEEILPRYEEFEAAECFDRESWKKAGAAGLLCASMPEEFGGAGGTYAHETAILEAISHVGVDGFGIALHNSIVAPYIQHYGSQEQKEKWLPKMATGELIGAIAMSEPGTGSDLQSVKTTGRSRMAMAIVINGSEDLHHQWWVSPISSSWSARPIPTKPAFDGVSLMRGRDRRRSEGFKRGRLLDKVGMKAQDTAELFFEDVLGAGRHALLGPRRRARALSS